MSPDSPSDLHDNASSAPANPVTETGPATDQASLTANPSAPAPTTTSPWIRRLPRWLWPLLKPVSVSPENAANAQSPPQPTRRWHFKTGALISLLLGALLLGGIGGSLYSYQLFAKTLGEQGGRLDAQNKEMKKLGLEARQQAQAASESQAALQQTQQQLENVRNQFNRTMAAMRAQATDMAKQHKENSSLSGVASAPADAGTQFSGNCSVDANTPIESLSRCLEGLPQ